MKGVQYVVDNKGNAKAVLIDLKKFGELWEDFQDLLVSRARRKERRFSLAEVEARAIYYHTVLARARLGRGAGDFAGWLRGSLGRDDLAAAVERTDPYLSSLERVRSRLLDLLDAALEAGPAAEGREPVAPA